MKSHVNECMGEIEDELARRHKLAGQVVVAHIRQIIQREDLIDTGEMLRTITSDADATGFVAGSPQWYAVFPHNGFTARDGTEVQGIPFITDGLIEAIPDLMAGPYA